MMSLMQLHCNMLIQVLWLCDFFPQDKIDIVNTGRVECVFHIQMYLDDAIKTMFVCGTKLDKMTGIQSEFYFKK